MVKRFISFFFREYKNVHMAAFLLAVSTFASQILALIRDRIFATQFGPGQVLDTYYSAFRVPDLLFITIASLASVTVLAPKLNSFIGTDDKDNTQAKNYLGNIAKVFSIFMIGCSFLAFLLMPLLAKIVAPGFDASSQAELVLLSRIMLLSPIMLGFSNLLSSVTQIYRRFTTYALSPVLYNLGIIIGALFIYPHFGIVGLAFGVVIGAIMHVGIQVPAVRDLNMTPVFQKKINWSEIYSLAATSLPRTLTLAFTSIGFLALTAIASDIGEGSISRMQFAYNLQSVPIAIIGLSYGVAVFPTLTKYFSSGDKTEFSRVLSNSFRHILLWSVPVAVFFVVLRAHIVRVILGAGEFTWDDTKLTAAAFALFTISAVFQSLLILIIRAYYASGTTWKPLKMGLIATVVQTILAFVLTKLFLIHPEFGALMSKYLRVTGVPDNEMLMLPLAYTIGTIINFVFLWGIFKSDLMQKKDLYKIGASLKQILIASLFSGFVVYMMLNILATFFNQDTFKGIFLQGFLSAIVGAIMWGIVLKWFKNEEFSNLYLRFSKKTGLS
ncbi:hypothetical protein H6790_01410 [Candidatus Nomurabacteria bacterium]|nr:hypothetical protein [Candidatus Nomurabacteria bacterium]